MHTITLKLSDSWVVELQTSIHARIASLEETVAYLGEHIHFHALKTEAIRSIVDCRIILAQIDAGL